MPTWPLRNDFAMRVPQLGGYWPSRAFGARRGKRFTHAGIDLRARGGDTVYAMEGGRIVGIQGWGGGHGDDTRAMLIRGDETGTTQLYGAIGRKSWEPFGLKKGSRVVKGQPIARVGRYSGGSSMLHVELYTEGRTNQTWPWGAPQPSRVLDPTQYLLDARAETKRAASTPLPAPQPGPHPRPGPQPQQGAGGAVVFLVVGLALLYFATEEGWL